MKYINQIVFLILLLLNCLSKCTWTGLHQAAREGSLKKTRGFLKRGEDIHVTNEQGSMPLHVASFWGNQTIVKFLLENGADVNAATKKGNTPLHFAARKGYEAIIILLIKNGANIRVTNQDNYSPFDFADKFNHTKIATLLRCWPKYQNLLEERKEGMHVFLMATYPRLGATSSANVLPKELFAYIWEFVKPTIEEAENLKKRGMIDTIIAGIAIGLSRLDYQKC